MEDMCIGKRGQCALASRHRVCRWNKTYLLVFDPLPQFGEVSIDDGLGE